MSELPRCQVCGYAIGPCESCGSDQGLIWLLPDEHEKLIAIRDAAVAWEKAFDFDSAAGPVECYVATKRLRKLARQEADRHGRPRSPSETPADESGSGKAAK